MDISIWTDIFEELNPEDALERLLKSSFRNFEFSCTHLEYWIKQGKPQKFIDNIKEKIDDKGANFIQLHAHLEFDDQVPEIKKIQDKIVAVHIADNLGEEDDHLYPLRGEIKWDGVIPLLADLDLPLNYEVPGERAHTPLDIRDIEVDYGYRLGEWMIRDYS